MITLTSMTAASMLDCTDRKPTYQYEGTLQKFNEKLLQVSVGKKENEAFYLHIFIYMGTYIYTYIYVHAQRYVYMCVENVFDPRVKKSRFSTTEPGAAVFLLE